MESGNSLPLFPQLHNGTRTRLPPNRRFHPPTRRGGAKTSADGKAEASRRTPKRGGRSPFVYKIDCRRTREPGFKPKPFPPRGKPLGNAPLPVEGSGAGPVEPPPATATGGAPKVMGAEGSEPMYCEYARQKSVWLPSCTYKLREAPMK